MFISVSAAGTLLTLKGFYFEGAHEHLTVGDVEYLLFINT